MEKWLRDRKFDIELKKLVKKYSDLERGLKATEKLLVKHFDPVDPKEIPPGKIHRVHCFEDPLWTMWKVKVVVNNLKPGHWPRIWIIVRGTFIIFLMIASHAKNYDDNRIEKTALDLASNYLKE